MEKEIEKFPHIIEQITYIKEFAEKMGCPTYEYYFNYNWNKSKTSTPHKAFCIELTETADGEGNPYSWQWSMETGEPIW